MAVAQRRVEPLAVRDRALAPDVARGAMLLLIALVNVHTWLSAVDLGYRGYPLPESMGAADRTLTGVQLVLADGRAYPLFGLLFGYGCVQLTRRLLARGGTPDAARQLLRRRGWWMVAIGAAHGVLLFPGDIVAAYGLIAVVLGGVLVAGRARQLRRVAVAGLTTATLIGMPQALRPPATMTALLPSVASDSWLLALAFRAVEWVGIGVVVDLVNVTGAVAIGAAAARAGVLDEPWRHRRLLRRTAVAGLGLAVLGGLPMALVASGAVGAPPVGALLLVGGLHAGTGYAGGIGYAALFALLAARASDAGRRPGPVVGALAACGQRSLTCYLGQSLVFAVLLPAWSLHLGADLPVVAASALGAATWLAWVVVAGALDRAGRRGPAEVLLRRLTYRA